MENNQALDQLAHSDAIFVYLVEKEEKHDQILAQFEAENHPLYYIGKDSPLLPFLSIQDNLLVGIDKKNQLDYTNNLWKWWQFFKLEKETASSKAMDISLEDQLLIHLSRALSQKNELIFLDNITHIIPTHFVENLLPTLELLSKECHVAFIILTDDPDFFQEIDGNNVVKYKQKELGE